MPLPHANTHLPPHLREVCDILARGLLRLRSRAAARIFLTVAGMLASAMALRFMPNPSCFSGQRTPSHSSACR